MRYINRIFVVLLFSFPFLGGNDLLAQSYFVQWQDVVGATVAGNVITKTEASGWDNSGAFSQNSIGASQDGWVEFKIPFKGGLYTMVGLAEPNVDVHYASIDYAFYINGSSLQVYESGFSRINLGTCQAGESLKIERIGSTVYYKRNAQIVYTSGIASSAELGVDVSLNSTNARVEDVLVSHPTSGQQPANISYDIAWTDLVGVSADGNTITKTAAAGWGNGGAASINILNANTDGWIEYQVDALNKLRTFGFSDANTDASYNTIDYAWHTNATDCYVYLNGSNVANYPLQVNDILRIERIGSEIHFKLNGVTKRIETNINTGSLFADCAISDTGAKLTNTKASFRIPCNDIEYELGADRRSDATKAIGGMLKKIIYPTKGYTQFEYEANSYSKVGDLTELPPVEGVYLEQQFLDPVYSNSIVGGVPHYTTTLTAQHSQWQVGWAVSVQNVEYNNLPERAEIAITQISNCDPNYSSCSVIQRDTDFCAITNCENNGNGCANRSCSGTSTFTVIPGETYQVMMSTGATNPDDVFDAEAMVNIKGIRTEIVSENEVGEPIVGVNIEVGGLRISKVTNYDYTGIINGTKKYIYEDDESGLSYGVFNGTLTYLTESESVGGASSGGVLGGGSSGEGSGSGGSSSQGSNFRNLNLSSSFVDPVDGSHITYKKVVLVHGEKGEMGKEVFEYETPVTHTQVSNSYKPYPLKNSFLWRRNLKNHIIYNSKDQLIRKATNNYNYGADATHSLYERYSRKIAFKLDVGELSTFTSPALTLIRSEFMYLDNTVVTDYYGQEAITTTTTFDYDNPVHLQMTKKTMSLSDGGTSENRFKYPEDDWSTDGLLQDEIGAITEMRNRHIVGMPIETSTYKGTEKLASTHSKYIFDAGLNLVLINEQKKAIGNSTLEAEMTMTKYDSRGNVLEFQSRDGIPSALIWGYDKKYVVALIQNATYSQVEVALGGSVTLNGPNGNVLSTLQIETLKNQLPNSLVTTYGHEPLRGLTLQTDPNGIKTTYEYDGFGRLYWVKDNDNNLLKKYEYKINGN